MEATRTASFDDDMYNTLKKGLSESMQQESTLNVFAEYLINELNDEMENLIYENDMPEIDIEYNQEPPQFFIETDSGIYPRWKPNGITDNRKEWRKKHKKRAIQKFIDVSAKYWKDVDDPTEWVRNLRT